MNEIHDSLKEVPHLMDTLADLKEETVKHSQLATARENLKHIFMLPETVRQTEAQIQEGKLLDAHKVKYYPIYSTLRVYHMTRVNLGMRWTCQRIWTRPGLLSTRFTRLTLVLRV